MINETVRKKLSPKSVKRFYDKNFFYPVLEYFSHSQTLNQYSLSIVNDKLPAINKSLGYNIKDYTPTLFTEVLSEALRLKLIVNRDSYKLTKDGNSLLKSYREQNSNVVDKILVQKMQDTYSVFSYLIESFYKIGKYDGLIIFPKPYLRDLGYSKEKLKSKEGLVKYVNEFVNYADELFIKYTNEKINKDELANILFDKINDYVIYANENKIKNIQFSKIIRDVAYDYYIKIYFKDKLDRISFNIWLERSKSFGLLNSSEFFPNMYSTVIYPISKIVSEKLISDNIPQNFLPLIKYKKDFYETYLILKFSPKYSNFKEDFLKTLWKAYTELSTNNATFFISLHDLRDIVCYQLQIEEKTFNSFLENTYKESINDKIEWDISLEVDILPEERKVSKSKRFPILINNTPKNIVAIKMKSK